MVYEHSVLFDRTTNNTHNHISIRLKGFWYFLGGYHSGRYYDRDGITKDLDG